MDHFFNPANPIAGMTGISTTTTTTTALFLGDPGTLGAAAGRLNPMMPGMPGMPMGGVDPAMMGMIQQQQQMTNMLLYMIGMLLGLMAGQQGAGANNPLASLLGGGSPLGSSGGTGGGSIGSSGGTGGGGSSVGGGMGPDVPTNAPTEKVGRFIDIAKAQQGDPYVFGATGPDKFDCSGLVYYALKQAGVNQPRMTADGYMQHYKNSRVDRANLKPGDLIFFYSPNSRGIGPGHATHVEIYLGNGMSMGTDNPSEGARIEPVNWDTFIGGARVPELYR